MNISGKCLYVVAVEDRTNEFKEHPPEYFFSSYKLTLEKLKNNAREKQFGAFVHVRN